MAKRGRASKEEIQYVVDNYGKIGNETIATNLNRSEEFVVKVSKNVFPIPVVDEKQVEIDRLKAVISEKDEQIASLPKPINMHNIEKAGFVVSRDPSGKSKGMIIGTEAAAQKSDEGFVQKKTNVTLRRFSDSIHRPSEG